MISNEGIHKGDATQVQCQSINLANFNPIKKKVRRDKKVISFAV